MADGHTQRVSTPVAIILVLIALVFDGAQLFVAILNFIPIIGTAIAWVLNAFIAIIANAFFYICFSLLGAKWTGVKTKVILFLCSLLEITPLGFLPINTFKVIWTILILRAENRLLSQKMQRAINAIIASGRGRIDGQMLEEAV